jgi:hypothetical protein
LCWWQNHLIIQVQVLLKLRQSRIPIQNVYANGLKCFTQVDNICEIKESIILLIHIFTSIHSQNSYFEWVILYSNSQIVVFNKSCLRIFWAYLIDLEQFMVYRSWHYPIWFVSSSQLSRFQVLPLVFVKFGGFKLKPSSPCLIGNWVFWAFI